MKATLFKLIIGMVVIGFALSTLLSGFAQSGIDVSFSGSGGGQETVVEGDVQVVTMTADYRGYTPSTFRVKQGVPVRWEINATQITGCTDEIIVPDLGIRKPLEMGINIIEFVPEEVGTIGFSCWMGMVRGKFIVE